MTAAKPIVITGARGYIGSALAKHFADEGRALRLVSRVPEAPPPSAAPIEAIAADLRDETVWRDLIAGSEAIVHLSSRTDLRAAEADPVGDENINIEPVRALIRAAGRTGKKPRVVFASSVTVVGIAHANPVDERTPDNPCSVYDRHKLACEALLREATKAGVLEACSLRLSNVYGYGRASVNANRGILNAMLKRATLGEPLTIYGDGHYIRDFTFLGDVVEAFRAAALSDRAGDGTAYVIARGQGHTLAEAFALIAQEALAQMDRRVEIRHVPEPADLQPIERRNFVGNSSLFGQVTGWQPRVDLRAGIRDYFERAATAGAAPAAMKGGA